MQEEKTFLKFIDLTQLFNWSVQGLVDAKFSYSKKYDLAKIGCKTACQSEKFQ